MKPEPDPEPVKGNPFELRHEYDAIIGDLRMPKLRGDEFYLNAPELRPELTDRSVFITGYATDPVLRSGLVENEVKFLVKPFLIKGLIACVDEMSPQGVSCSCARDQWCSERIFQKRQTSSKVL